MGLREESPDGSCCPWAVHLPVGHVLSWADQVGVLFSSVSLKGKLCNVGGLLPCLKSVGQEVGIHQNGKCSTGWHRSPYCSLGYQLAGWSQQSMLWVCALVHSI